MPTGNPPRKPKPTPGGVRYPKGYIKLKVKIPKSGRAWLKKVKRRQVG
jgi:hypothetical protein